MHYPIFDTLIVLPSGYIMRIQRGRSGCFLLSFLFCLFSCFLFLSPFLTFFAPFSVCCLLSFVDDLFSVSILFTSTSTSAVLPSVDFFCSFFPSIGAFRSYCFCLSFFLSIVLSFQFLFFVRLSIFASVCVLSIHLIACYNFSVLLFALSVLLLSFPLFSSDISS